MARQRDVNRLVLRWRERLWLGHWLIGARISPTIERRNDPTDAEGFDVAARVNYESAYRRADIEINGGVWDSKSDREHNRTICHEMVHVAMSPVDAFVKHLMDELPLGKKTVAERWWKEVDESMTEHWCNVMLDANKELK